MIILKDLGEGWSGDYDSDDPNDTPLLRFDVSVLNKGTWEAVDDASYCTQVPANTDGRTLIKLLEIILEEVTEPVLDGYSIKKICEKLSWITPSWIVE